MKRFPITLNLFRADDIPFVLARNNSIYDRLYYSTIYDLTSIIKHPLKMNSWTGILFKTRVEELAFPLPPECLPRFV